jgi:hypothetical protein
MHLDDVFPCMIAMPKGQPGPWRLARVDYGWRWIRADGAWVELHEAEDGRTEVADSTGRVAAFDRFALAHAETWRRRTEL